MIIGFCGASGRTDASHCALLVARTIIAVGERAALVVVGRVTTVLDGSIPSVRLGEDVDGAAPALRSALATAVADEGTVVVDLPRRCLERADVRAALDVAVVAVGPHRADERAAAAVASVTAGGPTPWYLAWRRVGGAPAAARFAAAMAELSPGTRILPVAVPPLGRAEAAALERSAPAGRAYRFGLDLLDAIREAAGHRETRIPEARPTAMSDATGTLADRLRDLADDVEAAEAGLPPDPAELAEAPILDAWSIDAIPVPVLKGRVTGHTGVVDGHRVRTTEVYLTDRATHARTLSRWYRLRAPAGGAASGLQ